VENAAEDKKGKLGAVVSDMDEVEYLARCHCGTLTARYRTVLKPSLWPVRACQCSFCRSHGALMTSDPAGSLRFGSDNPQQVSYYCFGARTAQFLTCRKCGVYVGVMMQTDKGRFGVLNVLSLRPLMNDLPAAHPMDYEGETFGACVARRTGHRWRWTAFRVRRYERKGAEPDIEIHAIFATWLHIILRRSAASADAPLRYNRYTLRRQRASNPLDR
jgi:hypothetical protein